MSSGAWLPFWLLGAPLVLAIIDRAMTPRPGTPPRSSAATGLPARP